MDRDMKVAQFVSSFFQWQEDHPVEAKEVCFEFLEATETTLDFKAKGMSFQLLLPTMLLQRDAEPDEILIAMNLDNSAPNSLMVTVNEKLERVRVGPRALEQGLDVFAKALISFEGKRKRTQSKRRVELQSSMGLLHDAALAIESSKRQANTVKVDEEKFSNDDSDADCSSDDLETHWSKGYLHEVTREARDKCEAARHRSSQSCLDVHVKPSLSGPSALLYVDDILQFCNVSAVSNKCQVRIQVAVAGFVNDVKIASSLGLPCSKTIQIFLEFDKVFWGERDLEQPLTLKRVAVGLEMSRSANFLPDIETSWVDSLGEESDEEFETECKKFHGRQRTVAYGTSTLIPELIKAFFQFKSGKIAVNLHSTPGENRYMQEALESFTVLENPLIGLICFIGSQMRALPSWCAVCWNVLPVSLRRLRTCQNDLCLYDFEELGLGATIHHEIQESPEVVELELSLACAAASSNRDVFEPFPSFFLTKDELRGRSGWFSRQITTKRTVPALSVTTSAGRVDLNATQYLGRPSIFRNTVVDGKERENKQLTHLLEILQAIPSTKDLRESTDENSLKKKLSKAAFSRWREKDKQARAEQSQMWLSYDLMRFILSTNRLSLRIMKEKEEFAFSIKPEFQFVVIHDSPEKEAIFNERRTQRGSFFAFHGSGPGNWYSILRNGLRPMSNTKYMSSGAAHGEGIYLADSFGLSFSYAKGTSHVSWKNGSLKEGMIVIAICEVVKGATAESRGGHSGHGHYPSNHMYIVPRGQEDSVSVRYLLVMNQSITPIPVLSIKGSILQENLTANLSINLRDKYERLKREDQALQQMSLLEGRMEAFLRMKVSGSKTDTESADKKLPNPVTAEASWYASPGSDEESPTSSCTEPISKRLKEIDSPDTKLSLIATATKGITAKLASLRNGTRESKPGMSSSSGLGDGSATATQAITKEFRNIRKEIEKSKQGISSSGGLHSQSFLANITVDIPNETNIYVWHVKLSQNLFTSYANLYKDLRNLATLKEQTESSVLLEVTFPTMYPFEPPFVRVVRPRFQFHTGHVTIGGSICMELLTTTGWLPSFSFESVLVQIVNAFVEGEGRIDMRAIGKEYSKEEAYRAFTRVADQHGWTVNKRKQQ